MSRAKADADAQGKQPGPFDHLQTAPKKSRADKPRCDICRRPFGDGENAVAEHLLTHIMSGVDVPNVNVIRSER